MSELHLEPEDRAGARRVLGYLQHLLRESADGGATPTPYQSTLRFLMNDLHEALRRPRSISASTQCTLRRDPARLELRHGLSEPVDRQLLAELSVLWFILRRGRFGF